MSSYNIYIQLWVTFSCNRLNFNPQACEVTDFLQNLFDNGMEYSGLNTARSALSTFLFINGNTAGNHPEVSRFMKGIIGLKPPMPMYPQTWDLDVMLKYLRSKHMWPLSKLNLLMLGKRLAMMLSLITGKRGQNVHLLDTHYMVIQGDTKATFDLRVPVKNYRVSGDVTLQTVEIRRYLPNDKLCALTTLKEYLRRTEPLRSDGPLFIVSQGDFHTASRATIARCQRCSCANNIGPMWLEI